MHLAYPYILRRKRQIMSVGAKLPSSHEFQTESGRTFRLEFCGSICGTSLFWYLTARPALVGIAGGTFDPPSFWYGVERELFCRSKADFFDTNVKKKFHSDPHYQPIGEQEARLNGG